MQYSRGKHTDLLLTPFLVIAFVLGGCGGGISSVRYYLVDPVAYSDVEAATATGLAVEILDVQVPQYLERFHIATRDAENQLRFSENHQWGENLRKNLLRTLAMNLSALLATNDVSTPLNRSMSSPVYRIQVHIEQFERDADGVVKLVARWQISGIDISFPVTTHKAELTSGISIPEGDYDRLVAVMQDLFGRLSETIAATVRSAGDGGVQRIRI